MFTWAATCKQPSSDAGLCYNYGMQRRAMPSSCQVQWLLDATSYYLPRLGRCWGNSSPTGSPSFLGPRSTPGWQGCFISQISYCATRFSSKEALFISSTPDSTSHTNAQPAYPTPPWFFTANICPNFSKTLSQASHYWVWRYHLRDFRPSAHPNHWPSCENPTAPSCTVSVPSLRPAISCVGGATPYPNVYHTLGEDARIFLSAGINSERFNFGLNCYFCHCMGLSISFAAYRFLCDSKLRNS